MERNRRESERRFGHTIDNISDRLQDVSSMSQSQSSVIKQLVGMIQGLQLNVEGIRHEQQQVHHTTSLNDESLNLTTSEEKISDRNLLYESISRLCNLDTTKDKDLFSKEAQSIIQDLGQIMASLIEVSTAATDQQLTKRHGAFWCDYRRKIQGRRIDALDQIGNILSASRRLNIREQGNMPWFKNYVTTAEF